MHLAAASFAFHLNVALCPLKQYGIWPNWKVSLSSETVLATGCLLVCAREATSAEVRKRLTHVRAAVAADVPAQLLLWTGRVLLLFFLFCHKLSGRFLGEGLGVGGRKPLECMLPGAAHLLVRACALA